MTISLPKLADIYEEEFQFIWNILRRYGAKSEDLEDLCHDVFIIVQRRLSTFESDRAIRPWLSGIAFRVLSDFRRKAYHKREVFEEFEQVSEALSAEDQAHISAQLQNAKSALNGLPLNNRVALVMHDIEGFSAPEIAESLDLPLNTVYSRVRLGRKQLSSKLAELNENGGAP